MKSLQRYMTEARLDKAGKDMPTGKGDKAADPKIKKLFGFTVPKWAQVLTTNNDPDSKYDTEHPEEHTIGDIFIFLTDKDDVKEITVDDLKNIDGLDDTVSQRIFGGDWNKLLDFIVKQKNNEGQLWTCHNKDKNNDITYLVHMSTANIAFKNPRRGIQWLR